MWGPDEILRLELEALCLLFGVVVASMVSKRRGTALGILAGFTGGVAFWLLTFVIQLRWFAIWS